MKYGICEWCAGARDEALFRRVKDAGLTGIQVSYETADFAGKMTRYAAWAAAYGITLTSIGANVFCERAFFLPENTAWVEQITADIASGAALTAGRLFHVPSFGASTIRTDEERAQTAAGLRRICDVAAAFSVRVGTENALSLAENEELLAAVDRPNLCLYFDTANPQGTDHPDAPEQAHAFAARIPEVHAKDFDAAGASVTVGEGVTHFTDTLAALIGGGYDGWLLLENGYDRAPDFDEALQADAAALRAATERLCRS